MSDYKELAEQNMDLVHYVLQTLLRVPQSDPEYQDLAQEGMAALVLAAKRYSENNGTQFSTYAVSYISGYIKRYRREQIHSGIRLPRHLYDLYVQFLRLLTLGYEETDALTKLGITAEEYYMILNSKFTLRLDQPIYDERSEDYIGTIGDTVGIEERGYLEAESSNELDAVLDECLTRSLLSMHDGIRKEIWKYFLSTCRKGQPESQRAIAAKFHVTQPTVSKTIIKGKAALKRVMERKGLNRESFS